VDVRPPQITLPLDATSLSTLDIEDTAVFSLIELDGADLLGATGRSVVFDKANLSKLLLTGSDLPELKLTDVRLSKCDLANAALLQGSWKRVEAIDCRMTGVQLGETVVADVRLQQCKLNLANMRFARLTSVLFTECDLRGADFHGATLQNVAFEDCELADAQFAGAKLSNVDLRSSRIAGLKSGEGLSGAIIDSLQLLDLAPLLAASIGLRVEDGGQEGLVERSTKVK
jgi:uncharacterized protein YjbI with pentapeptide repeats